MKMRIFPISHNSIRFRLVIGLLGIMLPLISLLIYNNFYATSVVRNQVAESYKNMMSLYMKQLDNNLEDVDKYLSNLEALNIDLQMMEYTNQAEEYYLAKMRLFHKVNSDITMYKSVNSIFIYSVRNDDFFVMDRKVSELREKEYIKEYIIRTCGGAAYTSQPYGENWYVKKIEQVYYLFRILKMGDTYIGAWVNAESLLMPLNIIEIGENGVSLLTTGEGEPMVNESIINDNNINLKLDLSKYYLLGEKYKYLVVGEKSIEGNYNLIALIPDDKILEKLPYLQRINTLISLVFIGILPLSLILLRKILLLPLKHLISAMRRIQEGNLEARIKPHKAPEEFQIVNETFNTMMTQIQELKINVYEEKINRQKAELQHLQLQINPHFFLNSLNILYTLARAKNFELIQEMSMSLIQYFRYMFRSNHTFVSLKDELQHVTNYIRIQELRFPNSLSCEIDAPEFLQDTPVPPLIIHTFIENSIKYAVSMDESVRLMIHIEFEGNENTGQFLKLIIEDTGKGFKEEVLRDLCEGKRIVDEMGEHIGIWNIQRRLQLLYKDKSEISFSNGIHGGAVVEIILPLETGWKMEEKSDAVDNSGR